MNNLQPIVLTKLMCVINPKGNVYHGLKVSDVGFSGFGEAYFTTINNGNIKGWKKHKVMHMNLIVPYGIVRFFIHNEFESKTYSYDIGFENYYRLTVPPGYWVAFQGIGESLNLILNIASIEHNTLESETAAIDRFSLDNL